jgi:hypothetical protein
MDSRTILDTVGADKLIGKGDMLFSSPELSKPVRLQGAYLSDDEIKKVVDYLQASGQQPDFDPTITSKASSTSGGVDYSDSTDGDELFEEAKSIVVDVGRASTSLLQRKLKVGYSRAARLMDLLEEAGVVSGADGAKPREILVTSREVESQGFDIAEEELQPVFDEDVDSKEEVRMPEDEVTKEEEEDQIPESEPLFVSKPEPVEEVEEIPEVIEEEVDEDEIVEKADELTEDELEAIEEIDESTEKVENKEEEDDWSK